ncbi:GNAT family N-acetyltransferase [Cellulomonas alba]|uniref:N-acetyltransferase family protein n=1 Tax=Cellulomonas alba TaxID=3053467 RepID=A0ABT7SCK0_9CELL|nr:GNAT family N-acetyltransferase [Cellulomonas alba]MDM7853905.1 N-acetyltransferase family protein [Cellulomonas alba]
MTTGDVTVVPLASEHWPDVARIYAAGIATGHATFADAVPTWQEFDAGKLPQHRFVALDADGAVVGWVAVSPVSERCVYAGVVELSVYVDPAARGRGVGRLLVDALLASTDAGGVWTVQGGVFPENVASLGLHAAAGFRVVGTRERLGLMTHGPLAGRWRDVVLLERRAGDVGSGAARSSEL